MTTPSDSEYDPAVHFERKDIIVGNPDAPQVVSIRIKQSMTDPFQRNGPVQAVMLLGFEGGDC